MDFLQLILLPFTVLYGAAICLRNKLFDWHLLPSKTFKIPVISVGNLSVGGTGKTPHIEYLVRLLSQKNKLAILSRGYGRKTKGFLLATEKHTARQLGDEPLQFKEKFKNIEIAVDERRKHGILQLLKLFPALNGILLDDAYQHRYVKPGLSILLTDYHRLYVNDFLLPSGRLREPRFEAKRADIIIVTKTPKIFSPIVRRQIAEKIQPKNYQNLFFSYISYGQLVSLATGEQFIPQGKVRSILLVAGIANCYPLQEHLNRFCDELLTMHFADHHDYTIADLKNIEKSFSDIFSQNKIIVTTEKDAMRLKNPDLYEIVVNLPIYYLPIEIEFHKGDKEKFDKLIWNYVKKNQ